MEKRVLRTITGLGIAFVLWLPIQCDAQTVNTKLGLLRGKMIHSRQVKAFLGIPYAAAPVGDLRWREPQLPLPWKGERDATRFGAHCIQLHIPNDDTIFQDNRESEDCLFLNVYAPASANSKSQLPVMFWIHGGGYLVGSGSEPRFSGDYLPTKGIVLVTINYRLGVFGFLATAELAKEAGGSAGNYGLLDVVAALHWVRNNIAEFGGDPNNVTIFGESVGSVAVSTLMASQLARGLFQKAIGESGSALGAGLPGGLPDTEPLRRREQSDEKWVTSLHVASLRELRSLPATTVLEATRGQPAFWQDIDGKLVTEPVEETYARGAQAHIPLLIGWNREESSPPPKAMTAEKWTSYASAHFRDLDQEFFTLYPGRTDAQATLSAQDYNSDTFIGFGTWRWIEAHKKSGGCGRNLSSPNEQGPGSACYRYHFELAAPPSKFHPGSFAFHGDELEYVFGTLDTRPDAVWRPEDRILSEQMMSYWTHFARTGDPNGPGLPQWPKYGDDDMVIHLDKTITSRPDSLRPRYEFLQTFSQKEHPFAPGGPGQH
jgi:para-nitrobenzyl esterase